jgi:hypothetical protein
VTESRDGEAAGPDEVEERWIAAPVESMVSLLDDSHLGRT